MTLLRTLLECPYCPWPTESYPGAHEGGQRLWHCRLGEHKFWVDDPIEYDDDEEEDRWRQ